MGEEKPDEELMGKRKSSPRLSTASCEADDNSIAGFGKLIPRNQKKIEIEMFGVDAYNKTITIIHRKGVDS